MNFVLDHCPALEELSVKRLRGIIDGVAAEPIGPGCSGDWDKVFPLIADRCTNAGLRVVAGKCKLLRKLHIDGWKANRIGDQGLIAVANSCLNLRGLVLIGVNPTNISLEMLASNCQNLEWLALCGSDTVGDAEISCIAAKCIALKKLCIKSCPVSDHGMEALASGCPNLIKVKVKKCRGVTPEGVEWLRANRGSLAINLDTGEQLDASASDGGAQHNGVEFPPIVATQIGGSTIASSSAARSKLLGLLSGRSMVACTLRRFANTNGGSSQS
ncbi:putative Mannose-P-dolichol utilization defect 1 protein [Hibiscus syriacus]|uniref:Putative Mannose-P-dolichol utilization defect 1 protein n=1 Tax=Hibiscus syriacus TaxID=106335 RepID=A0A6A2XG51_HIBSY|nr:putative Mannose-P-dolichol utilization defect 1 protein [Hibiscus syriacus]KAE8674766.1 putative Mannose-P-dolichol utilization defect 1 protein [Hibiscus syriacus]